MIHPGVKKVSEQEGSEKPAVAARVAVGTRVRKRRKSRRAVAWTFKDFLRAFLLMNIIPLIGAIVLGVMWYRGEIDSISLPEGTRSTLIVLGVILLALILLASLTLPSAHGAVRAIEEKLGQRKAVFANEIEGSKLGASLSWPVLVLCYAVLWPVRFVLILASIALIVAFIVFCVRLLEPGFLQSWIDVGMEWVDIGLERVTPHS